MVELGQQAIRQEVLWKRCCYCKDHNIIQQIYQLAEQIHAEDRGGRYGGPLKTSIILF